MAESQYWAIRPGEDFLDPRDRTLYSPISDRPAVAWPNGASVAVWVAPNVEFYEYTPPLNDYYNFFPRVPNPDVQQYALRDYGNRVGFWRMADVFDDFGIRPTVSLNVAVLEHLPQVRDAMVERNWAFMSHGVYNTRPMVTFDEAEEQAFYSDTIDTVYRHTGQIMKGMLGPSASMNQRTPDLMAEAGMTYHADWWHDDQPVPIRTRTGRLVSMPYGGEGQNDGDVTSKWTSADLSAFWKAQFDWLRRVGKHSGRVLCMPLHPYSMGQPHAIGHLADVFEHMARFDDVWYATAEDIAEYYLEHCYEEQMQYAVELAARKARGER
jgi:allantoinase